MRSFVLLVLILTLGVLAIGQERIELPAEQDREELIIRDYYAFSYSVPYEICSFVAYRLTPDAAGQSAEQKGKNHVDKDVVTGTGTRKDYKKTGYAMGQLIPAEHFAHDKETAEQLFLMSNIAPMKPTFYSMTWKNIEKLFRAWAIQDNTDLFIAAGPILTDAPFGTIGDSKVTIPKRFYKVVLDLKNERAVGFVFKNSYAQNVFYNYAVSVDELEEITGIDFYAGLDTDLQERIESKYEKEAWDWDAVLKVYGE